LRPWYIVSVSVSVSVTAVSVNHSFGAVTDGYGQNSKCRIVAQKPSYLPSVDTL